MLRKARRESWEEFVGSINERTSSQEMWDKIRQLSGKRKTLQIKNGRTITNPKEMAKQYAETSSDDHYTQTFKESKKKAEEAGITIDLNNEESYNDQLNEEELDTALSTCTVSSPGPDEIHYAFIKQMKRHERMKLLEVYNGIWRTGVFPTAWTEATVIPILKPGKDPNDPGSYRPISLTSCMCKVMEKIVNKRLQYIIETRKLLPETQFGFKRNRSTTDVLLTLENSIMEAIRKKEYTAVLSLDISKPYDTCWRFGILRKLKQWKIDGLMLKFISNFTSYRKLKVAVGNHHSTLNSI
jgi:hypothetical protein